MSGLDFQVDTGDYLGFNHQGFLREMYSLALSNPSKYFEIREKVIKSMRDENVKMIYKTLYNALVLGTNAAGSEICRPPHYPKQEVATITLGAAQTIQKIFEDAVELILPADFKRLAEERLSTKAKGGFEV
jgi:hypothetical protein